MTSEEFKGFRSDFNHTNKTFLERMAATLRNQLINNTHSLFIEALNEDMRNRERLLNIADDPEFLNDINQHGMPIFLKNHDPGWEDIQIGVDFVKAVSCRFVEKKLISEEAQAVTPVHQWPIGDEMIVYMPVVEPMIDDPYLPFTAPKLSSDDIFVRHISTITDENGITSQQPSTLYAIGRDYCFAHIELADAEAEIDLMMQDPAGFAADLSISRLNFGLLSSFNEGMVSMELWPINTYWPGVTTGKIAI